MCEKKCCPIWVALSAVMALAAIAFFAFLVVKKVHMLRCGCHPSDEVFATVEEDSTDDEKKDSDSGVRYTADQDFV